MRNHNCVFANYCDAYSRDKCQGCSRAAKYDSLSSRDYMILNHLTECGMGAKARKEVNMKIKNVIFNEPATIVYWTDGTKTVVKCQDNDIYSKETGLAIAIAKKALGNKGNFNEVFKKWIPEY